MIRDIFLVCDVQQGSPNAIRVAVDLAQRHDARLRSAGMIIDPVQSLAVATSMAGPVVVPPATMGLDDELAKRRTSASRIAAELAKRSAEADIISEWQAVEGLSPDFASQAVHQVRTSDLVVSGFQRSGTMWAADWATTMQQLVRDGSRPCLLVPEHCDTDSEWHRATIAWDRSASCARAVHDALPHLATTETVQILTVDTSSEWAPEPLFDDDGLAGHLRRHGLSVEVLNIDAGERTTAEAVREEASRYGSNLLVMGAFGHSQVRELLFGSTTRDMIESSDVPLVVSH